MSGRRLKDLPNAITLSFAYRTIDLRPPATVNGKIEFTLIPGPRYQELAHGVPKKNDTGIHFTTKFEDKKDITLASTTEWTKFEVPWDLRGIIRRIEHAKGGETFEFSIDLSEANGKIQLKEITLVPSN